MTVPKYNQAAVACAIGLIKKYHDMELVDIWDEEDVDLLDSAFEVIQYDLELGVDMAQNIYLVISNFELNEYHNEGDEIRLKELKNRIENDARINGYELFTANDQG